MSYRNFLFFLLFFLIATVSAGYAPGIVSDGNLDALLFRLSVRYGQPLPACYYLRPVNYGDLDRFFSRLSSDSLRELIFEEKYLISMACRRYGPDSALYHFSRPEDDLTLKVNCNLLGDVQPGIGDSAQLRASGIANPSFSGNLGRLSFYSGIEVWTEYRSDTLFPFPTYEPYDGVPYNLYGRETDSGRVRSSDLPTGGVSFDAGRIRLEAAIDRLRCGPARFFPLTLSGTAPPETFLRVGCDLGVVHYTHVAALLKSQKDKRKYLFMHRLEGDVWKRRVHFGVNEAVVYGSTTNEPLSFPDSINPIYVQNGRAVEPEYLIPFIPFKFIEHYDGDRDNAAVSADVAVYWPVSWCFYGEFFLDDMLSPWKLFTDDWGNKWALTLGCGYEGALKGKALSVIAEFSRVEPWVYTHFGGGSHRYTHFGRSLGSPLGPNSLATRVVSLLQLNSMHQIGAGIDLTASNTTTRGGKITDVFQHPDPENPEGYHDSTEKTFLGNGAVWYLKPAIYWNFNVFGRFSINSSCTVDLIEDSGKIQASFYGGLYF